MFHVIDVAILLPTHRWLLQASIFASNACIRKHRSVGQVTDDDVRSS